VLCPEHRAVNDHPLFHCPIPGHLPTLGPSCCTCDLLAQAKARQAEANAPRLAQLRTIRAKFIAERHIPWPGAEFGKGIFGMCLDNAIGQLEA
jgi:hypothetical protein